MPMFTVVYRIRATGVTVTKRFDSPYLCRKTVEKLRRSRKCELISYPFFG